jgi:hypothetical protein
MNEFHEGQRVKCIDADGNPALVDGEHYTISAVLTKGDSQALQLYETGDDRFYPERFERVL